MTTEQVLKKLGISFIKAGNRLTGSCPVHGGDNPTGFSMFIESGCWVCWTHNCQMEFSNTLRGFVKGVLTKRGICSAQELNKYFDKADFTPAPPPVTIFDIDTSWESQKTLGLKKNFLEKVEVPSKYYLARGFSAKTLTKYCVTDCLPDYYMKNRAIVPSFSDDGESIVGLSGRSLTDEHPKWLHSNNFKRNQTLYNYHNLIYGKQIILTEGFAKVWRLEECEIENSVGIYGTALSDSQIKLINKLAPPRIIIAMDNDEPGKRAAAKIKQQLELMYNTIILDTPIIDIDKATCQEVDQWISPLL